MSLLHTCSQKLGVQIPQLRLDSSSHLTPFAAPGKWFIRHLQTAEKTRQDSQMLAGCQQKMKEGFEKQGMCLLSLS